MRLSATGPIHVTRILSGVRPPVAFGVSTLGRRTRTAPRSGKYWALTVLAGAIALLPGCRPATVQVSYRPPAGAQLHYRVEVHSVTTTRLGDAAVERSVNDAVLEADDTVLASGPEEVRVRIRLRRQGVPDRTYVVRLDRAAQLAGVEAVEGALPSAPAPDALPEILPGAPGAPPNQPLAPGDRWTIDTALSLPGAQTARLRGSGRLVELGLLDGRRVATTRSVTRLPLRTTSQLRGGTLVLDGTEATSSTATRSLADGTVETSSSVSSGEFAMTLEPPSPAGVGPGGASIYPGDPVTGTLTSEVRSDARRVRG